MSQSPLARSTRRSLPAFAHTPSKLSKPSKLASSIEESPSPPPVTPEPTRRLRNAGTSTNNSPIPHTPQIHYSPYATSTPPGALSRSSSIPFDMAGNLRAGRRAEEEARIKSENVDATAEASTTGIRLKARFIRRKSMLQRLWDYPQHIIDLVLLHYPVSFESVLPPAHLANPISLAIHAIHYLLLAPLLTVRDEPDSVLRRSPAKSGVGGRWDRWEEEGKVKGRGLGAGWATILITALFLVIACANSIYLFTRFRTYDMQLRSAQDPLASPHASPISAPRPNKDQEDVFAIPQDTISKESTALRAFRLIGWITVGLTKWTCRAILSIFGQTAASSSPSPFASNEDKIQSLRVWEPPEFCLAFFCAFPPSAPFLSYLLTPLHPFLTPLLHLILSFLLSHLATSYAQLVKDRMVLSAEVMREYDKRFVYKKVFGTRVDRGVGTHEGVYEIGYELIDSRNGVFMPEQREWRHRTLPGLIYEDSDSL